MGPLKNPAHSPLRIVFQLMVLCFSRLSNFSRRRPVLEREALWSLWPLPDTYLQPVRTHSHCQLATKHIWVQGVQKQDANLSSQTPLRGQAPVPGTDVDEHCPKDDGDVGIMIKFSETIFPFCVVQYFKPKKYNGCHLYHFNPRIACLQRGTNNLSSRLSSRVRKWLEMFLGILVYQIELIIWKHTCLLQA